MTKSKAKPVRREGEKGWARSIARRPTEKGAILIDWDFLKERYFVTDCDLKEAVIIDSGKSLDRLMAEYDFKDEHLVEAEDK